jgi:hypothetical protein
MNAAVNAQTPIHGPAKPEEIVGIVLYLSSDEATYKTD